jgi:hypothetical protein
MFSPGQLNRLREKLDQMRSDMKNRMFEAAIATARGLFNDAVDLKEGVLGAETEWLYYHGLFLQTLADTESNLAYCENLQFTFEMEHGQEIVDARVNYWTNSALDNVSSSISSVKQETEQIQQISTHRLIGHIDTLNRQNVIMEIATDDAREALILSKQRAEMANALVDALEEVGWQCEGIVYEGEELKQPVHAKLSDGMGNEIVAIITPEIDTENMTNTLELNFFDERNDDSQRRAWIESIHNSLKDEGLEVGQAVCVAGYENRPSDVAMLRDIEATVKRGIEVPKVTQL